MYSSDIEELELKTFEYFIDELEYFIGDKDYDSFEEALKDFYENGELSSTIRRNFYVEDFFEPEFGITLKMLLSILKESGCSFKDYIRNLLIKYDAEKELIKDGFVFGKLDYNNLKKGMKETLMENNEVTDDKIKAAKKLLIKQETGVEDLNLDNLEDDDLDKLLTKATSITEKVNIIKESMKDCSKEEIAEAIARRLNMHKNEALSIV